MDIKKYVEDVIKSSNVTYINIIISSTYFLMSHSFNPSTINRAQRGYQCAFCLRIDSEHKRKCSGCYQHRREQGRQPIRYCDEACQRSDWRRHKPFCNHLTVNILNFILINK